MGQKGKFLVAILISAPVLVKPTFRNSLKKKSNNASVGMLHLVHLRLVCSKSIICSQGPLLPAFPYDKKLTVRGQDGLGARRGHGGSETEGDKGNVSNHGSALFQAEYKTEGAEVGKLSHAEVFK